MSALLAYTQVDPVPAALGKTVLATGGGRCDVHDLVEVTTGHCHRLPPVVVGAEGAPAPHGDIVTAVGQSACRLDICDRSGRPEAAPSTPEGSSAPCPDKRRVSVPRAARMVPTFVRTTRTREPHGPTRSTLAVGAPCPASGPYFNRSATTLIVVARITVPNRKESRACRRAAARIGWDVRFVSETW